MSLWPEDWIRRMAEQLREEMPAFLQSLEVPALRGLRFHPGKSFPDLLEWADLEQRIPWEENGWYLRKDSTAGTTVWHEAGVFYLQEPSAMIPGTVLGARPGEIILDLCAAPGGKATQMGLAMAGKGLLVANEPVEKRARILSRNIERMGIPNAIVTCERPEELARKWGGIFDAVLVDAPCSGEGMFRREPDTRAEWSQENAAGCARRQREILKAAAQLVRPGGRLIYSTCTFNPEENQRMAAWFVDTFSEYELRPFQVAGLEGPDGWLMACPHQIRGEGQFVASIKRKASGSASGQTVGGLGHPDLKVVDRSTRESWERAFPGMPEATHFFGNMLIRLEMSPPLKGVRVLRAGLHLGEMRGRVPIPDHAAALVFPAIRHQACDLTEAEAARYLAGEAIEHPEEGWVIVKLQGVALGWCKGSGGLLRNHYPKGLRNSRISCELPNKACQNTKKEI